MVVVAVLVAIGIGVAVISLSANDRSYYVTVKYPKCSSGVAPVPACKVSRQGSPRRAMSPSAS
jgi:hypothetical protein